MELARGRSPGTVGTLPVGEITAAGEVEATTGAMTAAVEVVVTEIAADMTGAMIVVTTGAMTAVADMAVVVVGTATAAAMIAGEDMEEEEVAMGIAAAMTAVVATTGATEGEIGR